MSDPDVSGESFSIGFELGDITYVPNPDGMKAMLHAGPILAALSAKAASLAAAANGMATVAGADYGVTLVANWPGSSRARANIWTRNRAARIDEARNATLLKALAGG